MSFQQVTPQLHGVPGVVAPATRQAQAEAERRARERGGASEEEVHSILSGGQILARWKIEITFLQNRRLRGTTPYGCQIWESGKALNGEGDARAWWCLDSREKSNEGCRGIIPQDCVQRGIAVCPNCGRTIDAGLLTEMTGGNVTMQELANYLADLFRRRLNSNADIYIKYHKTDPRYLAMLQAKGKAIAERLKGMHIYPLARIIRDVSAGADLATRFKAFLTS